MPADRPSSEGRASCMTDSPATGALHDGIDLMYLQATTNKVELSLSCSNIMQ